MEVDDAVVEGEKGLEVVDAPVEEQEVPRFGLTILSEIRTSQQQNGLRHGDYQRYRQYCSRRLRRIRRALKVTCGRGRFHRKVIDPETIKDGRFLLMPLVKAERSWSYAMQLKGEQEEEPRKRFHFLRRLQKAVRWSEELMHFCGKRGDQRTGLEAEAYALWMSGNLSLELEEWEGAQAKFFKARTIYDQLSKVDDRVTYQQRVGEIDTNLRFCQYNLRRGDRAGGETSFDNKDLLDMVKESQGPALDLLKAKLDTVLEETRKRQAETLQEIVWQGHTIPIKNEKTRVCILRAQEQFYEIEKMEDIDRQIETFDKLFIAYSDALRIIRDDAEEIRKKDKQRADTQIANLDLLAAYITFMKLQRTVDRNLLLVKQKEEQLACTGEKIPAKPDDLVHLYETLLQNMNDMRQPLGVEEDPELSKKITARTLRFKAWRCHYLAASYMAAKKLVEAFALFTRAGECADQALLHYHECEHVETSELDEIHRLANQARGRRAFLQAKAFLGGSEAVSKGMTGLSLEDRSLHTLFQTMDTYDASPAETGRLVDFPPAFMAVPCKPLLFDLAWNSVEYPDLSSRAKATQKGGGLLGRLWGWGKG